MIDGIMIWYLFKELSSDEEFSKQAASNIRLHSATFVLIFGVLSLIILSIFFYELEDHIAQFTSFNIIMLFTHLVVPHKLFQSSVLSELIINEYSKDWGIILSARTGNGRQGTLISTLFFLLIIYSVSVNPSYSINILLYAFNYFWLPLIIIELCLLPLQIHGWTTKTSFEVDTTREELRILKTSWIRILLQKVRQWHFSFQEITSIAYEEKYFEVSLQNQNIKRIKFTYAELKDKSKTELNEKLLEISKNIN